MGKTISKAFFFQPPKQPSYHSKSDFWVDKLIFINEDFSTIQRDQSIPCLFCPYYYPNTTQISNQILIFFHSTASDLAQDHHYISEIRNHLQVSVLGVEYPGYGIYKGNPSPEGIEKDALIVYNFVNQCLLYPTQDIIVMGLLMGTGPASYLCSQVKFSLLILIVPFKSWRRVAKDHASFLGNIVPKDYFNNFENLNKGIFNCKTIVIDDGPDEDQCAQCSHLYFDKIYYSEQMFLHFYNKINQLNKIMKFRFFHNMNPFQHDIYLHCINPVQEIIKEWNIQSHNISYEHTQYKLQKIQERCY
ncbi:hydrolase of the alpha/beta superfamily protein, putative (macronuclear) [Tetrahymena thermophila SB210]|uniref:Hydrolase of the alpha/beta superfamily protein, putative n=1 Tax=Tetrahymena thermophila (strain SB210) TaxID=312017 RepID=W7WY86_TETTS|nr:hydrolase of the alpha/beta superfamily protein, putative [Tetrahymena thermophila SB210]EWS71805.1 hydrolase of the alpha/beta superfamily protein, putative [Tetrahymena thermophila SB210]|eukprot:XP_012655692.1 hydrolase of the alpha/beta superfamily protein, putative [Tetrahymena thermophila SB210]